MLSRLPKIPSYTFRAYWNDLDEALKLEEALESKRHEQSPPASKKSDDKADDTKTKTEDEQAYQQQIQLLKSMLKLGVEIEDIADKTFIYLCQGDCLGNERAEIGERLNKLASKYYGKEEIPEIKGPRSLHAAEMLFLEHSRRVQQVTIDDFTIFLAKKFKGIDIPKRMDEAHDRASALKTRIDDYKRLHPVVSALSKEEQEKHNLEREIQELEVKRQRFEEKQTGFVFFRDNIIPKLKKDGSKARSLRELLRLPYGSGEELPLDKLMDAFGFNSSTKAKLLAHESNNRGAWYYLAYKPSATLLNCLNDEVKELTKLEKEISLLNKQIQRKASRIADLKTISKLQSEIKVIKEKENKELDTYKKTLNIFIKAVFLKVENKKDKAYKDSDKYKKLKLVQDELKKDDCKYSDVDTLKKVVSDIRKEVSVHRNRGCFWNVINRGRNTATLDQFNLYFTDQNVPKI